MRGVAGAAKLLGMDGIATDSENYRSDSQTWNWNYPGVTQNEASVRALARQRGHEFMDAVLAGFPNVEIINYRLEVPGSWEEKVQQQVNHVVGIWDKSVFPDFWGGMVDAGGFKSIQFFDPIFYKSWQVGSGWDEALGYNVKGVRATLAKRWANWDYASTRFFISPFAWIDPGPSAGSFDDARPPAYVAAQLDTFHRWGEGNTFGLYTQHIDDFDYTPYVPAMQAASTSDAANAGSPDQLVEAAPSPAESRAVVDSGGGLPGAATGPPLMRLERLTGGLREPTDAAFTPDGRLLIAERTGAIRIVRHGGADIASDLRLDELSTISGNGLLAIAIDPQFPRTHFVYAIYTAASRSGEPVFRLARFREVRDLFGEGAVLLDGVPAPRARATASLRFGPDGKLYVALDAGGDPRRVAGPGAYNGRILRLNADGTTPSDQPGASPVYATGYIAASGLDWDSETRALWIAGRDGQDTGRLRVAGQGEIGSIANPMAMAFYRGDLFPTLRGNLLVAGGDEPTITRLTLDEDSPRHIVVREALLKNVRGVISTLAVGPDGAIYFCVNDELMRLVANR